MRTHTFPRARRAPRRRPAGGGHAAPGRRGHQPQGRHVRRRHRHRDIRPTAMPPGSNNWSCRPSSTHPDPVVLVHGTLANEAFSWQALSPMLANAGYCVYAFNYGQNGSTLGHFFGLDRHRRLGRRAVDLRRPGAGLDRRGQGRPRRPLAGRDDAPLLPEVPGWRGQGRQARRAGPSNHGTTVLGLNALLNNLKLAGVPVTSLVGCVSCTQQIVPPPSSTG